MSESNKSSGWRFPLILGLILGAALLTFAFQNNNMVNIKFLFWSGKASLSLTYFATVCFTILIALLISAANWIRRGRMKREIKNLKEELEELMTKKSENKQSTASDE